MGHLEITGLPGNDARSEPKALKRRGFISNCLRRLREPPGYRFR